jgi:energy-coupling factor transporter ATP-binding protein EcfA2
MPIFVAVIGSRDSGKSTIIKSLTGCLNNSFRGTVSDLASKTSVEVIASSPQERAMSLAELRAHLKTAAKPSFTGIVCALQPSQTTKRLSMKNVLTEAQIRGFTIYAFVLDPPRQGSVHPAANVTSRLAALGLKYTTLDARQFAHLNAVVINKKSKIIR